MRGVPYICCNHRCCRLTVIETAAEQSFIIVTITSALRYGVLSACPDAHTDVPNHQELDIGERRLATAAADKGERVTRHRI